MAKFLAKLAIVFAKDPENASKTFGKILFGTIGALCIMGIVCMNMIGAFFEQADVINEEFDVAQTEVYQNIDRVYKKFRIDLQKAMDEREQEIIAENTTYVQYEVVEYGLTVQKMKAVCDVTVIKSIDDFSFAYILAYINHSSGVMNLEEYNFDDTEIYSVMETICKMKEEQSGKVYTLYTEIKSPEDVAAHYYPDDEQKQEMYLTSFELYEEFLDFVTNSSDAESDEGAEDGGHSTSANEDEIADIISNAPPNDEIAKKVLEYAANHLGVPYSQDWDKRLSGQYHDCSGLVYAAYKAAGIDCSYEGGTYAAIIAKGIVNNGTVVSVDNLKPGDLIFYSFDKNGRYMDIDHVAIYIGNGYVIDASYSKGYVVKRQIYSKGNIVLCGRPYR